MPTSWTKVSKPSTAWTKVNKATSSWTKVNKASGTTWTPVSKASTTSWSKLPISLISSYSESNWKFSLDYIDSLDAIKVGMNFTNVIQSTLTTCKFFLTKIGSPSGNIVAKLYAITGTYGVNSIPTGSALATSSNVDVSTIHSAVNSNSLVSSDYTLITFTFATPYVMTQGTSYVIVLEYSGGSGGNYLSIGGGDSNLPTGNPVQDYGSGWVTYTGDAYNFYVYGTGKPSTTWTKVTKAT